jgi:hypothetical protein
MCRSALYEWIYYPGVWNVCVLKGTLSDGRGKSMFRNVGELLFPRMTVRHPSDLITNFKRVLIQ